jgi:hypothetical protein
LPLACDRPFSHRRRSFLVPANIPAANSAHFLVRRIRRTELDRKTSQRNQAPEISLNKETALSGPNRSSCLAVPTNPDTIYAPLRRRDPDRVPTPLSGRRDRKGHYFPFSRTPSPQDLQPSTGILEDITDLRQRQRRNSSSSFQRQRPQYSFSMHGDQMASRYTPTSPLSPRLPATARPLSPQPSRPRTQHSRTDSRGLHMNLPRYHPANFPQGDGPTPTGQGPAITLNRAIHPAVAETPRMMRERQRELIERAKMSSKIAASSMGAKPDAPRLDPLGSPKGPMTPLALEDGAGDYFAVSKKTGSSPGASPESRSDGSVHDTGGDVRRKKASKAKTSSPQ